MEALSCRCLQNSDCQLSNPLRIAFEKNTQTFFIGETHHIVHLTKRNGRYSFFRFSNAVFRSLVGFAFDVIPNQLLVMEAETRHIYEVNCDTGVQKHVNCSQDLKLHYPCGIVVDSNGMIYVLDIGARRILKIDRSSNNISVAVGGMHALVQTSFSKPNLLLVDSQDNLYVGDAATVKYVDFSSQTVSLIETFKHPLQAMQLDIRGKMLYVWDSKAKLRRIDLKRKITMVVHYISSSRIFCNSLALDEEDNVLLCDYLHNSIWKITLPHPLEWSLCRLIWIGHLKEDEESCMFAKLPREIICQIVSVAKFID